MEKPNTTKSNSFVRSLAATSLFVILFLFLLGCASPTPPPPSVPVPPNLNINTTAPIATASSNVSFSTCATQDCFISAANACQAAQWTSTDDIATFQYYSTASCVFSKTLVKLNSNESAEMKTFLEGKNLSCIYQNASFDSHLVTSWVAGTDNCTGPLKDAIGELLLYAK